jgi:hypothetical protein
MRLVTLLALLCTACAWGDSRPALRLLAPTAFESGEPLVLSEIETYTMYCNGSPISNFQPTGVETTWVPAWGLLPIGTSECYATATARGMESGPSNSVQYTLDPASPRAPIITVVAQ